MSPKRDDEYDASVSTRRIFPADRDAGNRTARGHRPGACRARRSSRGRARPGAHGGVDRREDLGGQRHAGRLDVVDDLLGARGADDRRRHVVVLQHPGDSELRHRQAEVASDRLELRRRPVSTSSVRKRLIVLAPPFSSVARVPAGAAPGLVLAGEHALGDGRPDDLARPYCLLGGHDLLSMTRQSIEYCGWFEMSWMPSFCASSWPALDLLGRPLGDADVEGLALAGRRRRTPAWSLRGASRCRSGAPGRGRRSRCRGGVSDPSIDSRMCLRLSPTSLWPRGPVGQ